jgi:D-alanine--poly(phosphoribitol) ligase subunit 2
MIGDNSPSSDKQERISKMEVSNLRDDILSLVYSAIDEVDPLTTEGKAIEKNPGARLLGGDNGVDSLTFVNLVVAIEEHVHRKFGKSVVLVDEENMGSEEHPFRTIGTMAEYVEKVIGKSAAP